MKNRLLLGALLIGTASLFTACSDDNDSNPTLTQPTEFTLNTPAYTDETIDLENTESLPLSWSQPKFTVENAPINAAYEVQVSLDNSFTVSTDEAANDESGELVADYATIDRTTQKCTYDLSAEDLDKAIIKIGKYTEDDMPEFIRAYVRVLAYVQEGSKRLYSIPSNTVYIHTNPYYIELKDALPVVWYMVGDDFGWGNNAGVDCFPMFMQNGYPYDKKTGAGEITYMNYFTWNGWKIQPPTFDWNYGIMSGGSANTAVYRNGGNDGGNIWCSPEGFYKVTLNTGTFECKIEPVTFTTAPTRFPQINLAGTFNNWGDTPMVAINLNAENHVWCYVMTVAPGNVEQIKFKDDTPTWDHNWGFGTEDGEINICGKATQGGKNIGVPEGTWVIMFNDITGEFSIIAK